MSKRQQILFKIKSSVMLEDPTAEVILYGSRARGNFSKASDWDILILLAKNEQIDEAEDKLRDNLYEIELETGEIISTLVYSKDYWTGKLKYSPLYDNVIREGIRL